MKTIHLPDGTEIPAVGQGTWYLGEERSKRTSETQTLRWGAENGLTLIDTAEMYGDGASEELVGHAIEPLDRSRLFLVSKVYPWNAGRRNIFDSCQDSLDRLGTDYLDLYLIHQPMGDYVGAYRAMEEAYHAGKLRAIGVSTFYPARLADLCDTVSEIPAVNQVELHPFFQQADALQLMQEYGVTPEAWGPFAEGTHGIFTHPVLTAIGAKYGKSAAQVALRWNVQRGVVVIPKSVKAERMAQNFDIWNFTLSAKDMAEIAKLDIGHSEIVDHNNPNFVKMLHQLKVHD